MKTTYLNQHSGHEKLILGLTAVLVLAFAGFFLIFQGQKTKVSQSEIHNINYEMAKAKSAESLYSLEGREIDRDNQELEIAAPNSSKNLSTQKINQNKKAAAASAKAAVKKNVAPSTAANAKAKNKKTNELKSNLNVDKSRFSVQDAETVSQKESNQQSNYPQPAQQVSNENVAATDSDKKNETKKNIKTIAEWTNEIFASTDRAIILKFVAAFKNKDVTDTEFYALTNQLLTSADETKKGFGLYALRATPSLASYSVLVKAQGALNSSYQAYVQETLLSYHKNGLIGYLHEALNSNDKQIVLKTIEIVKAGVTNIKNGTTSVLVESRYRRDSEFTTFAVQNYQSFLPQLAQLQTQSQRSGDQDVFAAAGQLTQTIQSTSVVAANP